MITTVIIIMITTVIPFGIMVGSMVWEEVRDMGPAKDVSDNLERIYADFEKWRRDNKIDCSMPMLTKGKIGKTQVGVGWADFKGKAYDCRVMCSFLADRYLKQALAKPGDEYLESKATCAWAAAQWFSVFRKRFKFKSLKNRIHKIPNVYDFDVLEI